MSRKGLMKGLSTNLPDLEEPCLIFLLTKATKIIGVPKIDELNFSPGVMIQIDFRISMLKSSMDSNQFL